MQVVRAGLVALLDGEFGIEVVGQASDARAARDIAKRSEPDVALLDIDLPGTQQALRGRGKTKGMHPGGCAPHRRAAGVGPGSLGEVRQPG
ncbi:response regulator transcription factor [Streptomyces sp. NPDC056237]|uniref:response regulator transcription factor n=1 Tax=Streptomyces sp. NPDC056237 TaxID=3345758 RepID=UPI0035DDEF77